MAEIEYKLEIFEGPLDLLLNLIEKNKIDIFDIPISSILEQYLDYIYIMEQADLYIAAEFIDMVSRLLYIKSRLLLPKDENEDDPRDELVKILLEYSEIKKIAEYLSGQFDLYRNRYEKAASDIIYEADNNGEINTEIINPIVLYKLLMEISSRKRGNMPPPIESIKILTHKKIITMAEKTISVIRRLYKYESLGFLDLLKGGSEKINRDDIVATFAAVLELLRINRINITGDNLLECRFTLNRKKSREAIITRTSPT
ncbi:MAG: segregation/condensation protein A [Oscillospiraceae bacterium]|nr:segregation/condensation protein A [Oscillospiraceae bacterium]